MNMNEATKAVDGQLKISKIFLDGSEKIVVEDHNLVVLTGRQAMALSLYQTGLVSDVINTFKIGTGGCIDAYGQVPKVELSTQTGLNTLLLSQAISIVTPSPATASVTFVMDIAYGSANGVSISEAGLFRTSGALFSVKNHAAIPKTSDFALHYEWTIKCL